MTEAWAGSDPNGAAGDAPAVPDTTSAPRAEAEAGAATSRRSMLTRILATRLLPPSFLNFLSGLLAGAGINLLTGIVGGSSGTLHIGQIEADSAFWVIASILSAVAAHFAEQADQKASLAITPEMGRQLKETIIRDEIEQVAVKFWIIVAAALVATLGAILAVPGLSI